MWRYFFSTLLTVVILATPLPAAAFNLQPETLSYVVDAPLLKNAGRAVVSLRQENQDTFVGEIKGETSGAAAFFSGRRRDCHRTTMRLRQGKLQPLLYVEESWVGPKHLYKEYRFDHAKGRLELWRQGDDGVMVLKWETELTEPIYDPISAFYNFRLGGFGAIKGGDTISVTGIPYPHPETIIIHVGSQEPGNRQAAVTIRNRPFENEIGMVHIRFDDDLAPLSAWTRVLQFGKLSGRLVGRQ